MYRLSFIQYGCPEIVLVRDDSCRVIRACAASVIRDLRSEGDRVLNMLPGKLWNVVEMGVLQVLTDDQVSDYDLSKQRGLVQ
jgi:hypothetical protein